MKKPLTTKILSNPNHEFVQLMLYIYSMQTFIFGDMNRASRDKDLDKIEFYGPLASALGYILHAASSKRKEQLGNKVTLYRGFSLKEEDIKKHYEVGKDTNLLGFTSTTLKKSVAIDFAIPS